MVKEIVLQLFWFKILYKKLTISTFVKVIGTKFNFSHVIKICRKLDSFTKVLYSLISSENDIFPERESLVDQ